MLSVFTVKILYVRMYVAFKGLQCHVSKCLPCPVLSVCPSVCLSVCLSVVCLSVVCLSVCLSIATSFLSMMKRRG